MGLENVLPIIIALVALQFIIRFMQKRKTNVKESEWRKIDYKKRIDALMKGKNPDLPDPSEIIKKTPWGEEISIIPDNMRDVRRDFNLIREAIPAALRAKVGYRENVSRFSDSEKMFDEIAEIVKKHLKNEQH